MTISLVILPGTGLRPVQIDRYTTLATLASAQGVDTRQLCINGEIIPQANWASTNLSVLLSRGPVEVAALKGSKGN
jgi:hypothetical protein